MNGRNTIIAVFLFFIVGKIVLGAVIKHARKWEDKKTFEELIVLNVEGSGYVGGTECEKERMEALQLIEDGFQDVCVPECDENGYYVRRCTCNWYTCHWGVLN